MRQALSKYMKDNELSTEQMAEKIGVHIASIYAWRAGKCVPRANKHIKKLIKLGIMPATGETRREDALVKIHQKQDKKNMLKRSYRRHVIIPDIVRSQINSMLDGYVNQLGETKTWGEFQEARDTFIRDAYYLCRQGG